MKIKLRSNERFTENLILDHALGSMSIEELIKEVKQCSGSSKLVLKIYFEDLIKSPDFLSNVNDIDVVHMLAFIKES